MEESIKEQMEKGDRDYTNGEITVEWRPAKCVHATTCYRELIEVFNPRKRPWVNMKGASTDEIIKVVDKCPTQALRWYWNDEKKREEYEKQKVQQSRYELAHEPIEEKPVKVTIMKDGPILLQGKFRITGADGNELKTLSLTSLCRCGHSSTNPFCDGTHRKHGFRDDL